MVRATALKLYSAAALVLCAGCTSGDGGASGASTSFDGINGLKFGTSFAEAVATVEIENLNSVGVSECLDELPLRGCFLPPSSDAVPLLTREGVPYAASLSFNRQDQLYAIDLRFFREGRISEDECLSVAARTLDWLAEDFGPTSGDDRMGTGEDGRALESFITPAGGRYRLSRGQNGGGILMSAPFTPAENVQAFAITFFSTISGKQHCQVSVNFRDTSMPGRDIGS